MTDLRDKHVIVTGGSQGIGAAIAGEANACGARISLIARGSEALRSTAESIAADVCWQACDVTDVESLSTAIRALESRSGACDVLVCCAGTALPGRFVDVPVNEFDAQWQLNVHGSVAAALVRGVQRNKPSVTVDNATRVFRRFGGLLEPAIGWPFRRTMRQVRGSH